MAYKWTNSAIATATSAAGEDLLLIVVDPSGTPTSKKLTVSNLMQSDAVLEIIRDHFGDVVLQGGTGVTVTPDDPGNTLTVSIGQDVATSASPTFAGLTVASDLTLAAGSITSASGAISFGNENLSTTGLWTIGGSAINSGEAISAAVAGHNLSGTYDVLARFSSTDAGGYGIRIGQDGTDGVISGIGTSGLQFWTYNGSAWGTRYSISATGNHDFQSGTATFGGEIVSSNGIIRLTSAATALVDLEGENARIDLERSATNKGASLRFVTGGVTDFYFGMADTDDLGAGFAGSLFLGPAVGTAYLEVNTSGNFDFQSGSITTTGTLASGAATVSGSNPTLTISDTQQKAWVNGDKFGRIVFRTEDASGIGAHEAAYIEVLNDASSTTPTGNLVFAASAKNAAASEIMRLTSSGASITGTLGVSGEANAGNFTVTGTVGNWEIDTSGAIMTFSRAGANYIRATNAGGSLVFGAGGSTTAENALTLDASQNATFAGDATLYSADPVLTIQDTETASASAVATLRLAESGAGGSLGSYWDIQANAGSLLFIDQWNEGGGTGTRLTIDDSGNATFAGDLGIGTAPARSLHISASVPAIRLDDSDVANLTHEFVHTASGEFQFKFDANNVQASTFASFFIDGTKRFQVDDAGVDVVGDITATGDLTLTSGSLHLPHTEVIQFGTSSVFQVRQDGSGGPLRFDGQSTNAIKFGFNTASNTIVTSGSTVTLGGDLTLSAGSLSVTDSANRIVEIVQSQSNANAELFFADGVGDRYRVGTTASGADFRIRDEQNARSVMEYDASLGEVEFGGYGVFTTANDVPVRLVSTDASVALRFTDSNGSTDLNYTGSNDLLSTASNLKLSAGDLTLSAGNVGIGTASPQARLHLVEDSTGDALFIETTESSSTAAPVISLKRHSSSPNDGDYLGQIKFLGENDADQQVVYAKITAKTSDVTDTTEDGLLEFAVKKAGFNSINARLTHSDLILINGTGLEVDGNATFAGDVTVTGNMTLAGTGSGADGSMYLSATNGMVVYVGNTAAGSANDWLLYNGATSSVLANPTGTQDLVAYGDLTLSSGTVSITDGDPVIDLIDNGSISSVATDEGRWKVSAYGGQFRLLSRNDADSGGNTVFTVDRTGTTPTAITIPVADLRIGTTSATTGGQELLRVEGSGRLLNLHGSTGGASAFTQYTNSTTGTDTSNGFIVGMNGSEEALILNYESTPIEFYTAGTERMRLTSDGSLVLGETTAYNNTQIYTLKTHNSASGTDIGIYFDQAQSTATTGELRALYSRANATHTSGTVDVMMGVFGEARVSGAGGTTTDAAALWARVRNLDATATITNAYGLYIDSFTQTGTVTNNWSIYSVNGGASYLAGDLRIGTTSATSHGEEGLHVLGSASERRLVALENDASSGSLIQFVNSTTGNADTDGLVVGIVDSEEAYFWNYESTAMRFGTANTERFRVASDAYALGIGTTDVESWDVFAAIEFAESSIAGNMTNDALYLSSNAYYSGGWKRKVADESVQFLLNADGNGFQWNSAASSTADSAISWDTKMVLSPEGMLLVGDTANANMTVGLTLNQGANDDQILAFKSSDVAHGVTGATEKDTYGYALKLSSGNGGLSLFGVTQSQIAARLSGIYTTTATGKTTGTGAAVEVAGLEKSGTGTTTTLTSDQNVFGVRGSEMLFIVDAEGDFHYNGADGGAFDVYEDAHLVRAFANATSKETVRTAHDDWVQYNEQTLVEIGVLGAPVSEGGLINGAQLQRVHTGAIWQNYMAISDTKTEVEVLRDRLADTESRLAIAESKLKQLPQA